MFKAYKNEIADAPDQGDSCTALKDRGDVPKGLLAETFLSVGEAPYLRRLSIHQAQAFFDGHTETRMRLPEGQRQFMKELKPEVLEMLMGKNMPVIGMFVGDRLVSGCAILYTSDKEVVACLPGYAFDGQEEKTAVISAVWTNPDHAGKGYSKKVVELGMDIAVMEGRDVFRAKVDKLNAPSLALFNGFDFDTAIEGQDSLKVYPALTL